MNYLTYLFIHNYYLLLKNYTTNTLLICHSVQFVCVCERMRSHQFRKTLRSKKRISV